MPENPTAPTREGFATPAEALLIAPALSRFKVKLPLANRGLLLVNFTVTE